MTHLILLGLPGTGKTTIGRLVADAADRPFFDSDEMIEAEIGMTGREVAATRGVAALHDLESEMLRRAIGSSESAVIAAAASVADDPDALRAIEEARAVVVLLEAEPDLLAARQPLDDHRRPLTRSDLVRLGSQRESLYRRVADAVIDTGVLGAAEAAATVYDLL